MLTLPKGSDMQISFPQATARAIQDARAEIVTNVPGFGGTEIFAALCQTSSRSYPISFHEEVAFSIAHGASLVGKRSATLMKAHGVAKAANSIIDALSAGTTAGFVVFVFEDREGKHSDNIFDIAALFRGLKIPYRVPTLGSIYREVLDAFNWSESMQLPVALLMNAGEIEENSEYIPVQRVKSSIRYKRDVTQHVLCPLLAEYQRCVLDAKLHSRDWQAVEKPKLPTVPDTIPYVYQSGVMSYETLFAVFKKLRGRFVAGDTGTSGLFAFPPYDCIDVVTYMGGSLPLAIGAHLAGLHDTWAVTGDFSFIAAGHLGLVEAVQRDIPLKVLIFNDGRAQATGGQHIPSGVLERIVSGYQPYVRNIRNPQDAEEVEGVLEESNQAQQMRIVVAHYREA